MQLKHNQNMSLPTSHGYRDIRVTVYYDEESIILSKLFGAASPPDRYGLAVDKEDKVYLVLFNDTYGLCSVWTERHDEPSIEEVQQWLDKQNGNVGAFTMRRALHFDENQLWGATKCIVEEDGTFTGRDAIIHRAVDDWHVEGGGFLFLLDDRFLEHVA